MKLRLHRPIMIFSVSDKERETEGYSLTFPYAKQCVYMHTARTGLSRKFNHNSTSSRNRAGNVKFNHAAGFLIHIASGEPTVFLTSSRPLQGGQEHFG